MARAAIQCHRRPSGRPRGASRASCPPPPRAASRMTMVDDSVRVRLARTWETPRSLLGALSTIDHKTIGLRYIATALFFMAIGVVEALVRRVQLAGPGWADV